VELENLENLINFRITSEQGLFLNQFSKNASNSPNINTKTVLFLSQQYFWSSVPECFNLMSKCFDWDSESSGQSEIGNF